MAIINTWRWTGTLGSEWTDDNGKQSNWSLVSGPALTPGFPVGIGDRADIDASATITADKSAGDAEYMRIDSAATVTFASGNFGAGVVDNSGGLNGGLDVDGSAKLIIGSAATMGNVGDLDDVGLTQNGSLELQPGAQFLDFEMAVGTGPNSKGDVTVDGANFLVERSSPGASTGELIVGEEGDGSVNISANSFLFAETTIVGQLAGSNGTLTVDGSRWGGTNLTIGLSGNATGTVTAENGSNVALSFIAIGAKGKGELDVAGVTTIVATPALTIGLGTLTVSDGGEVNIGGTGVRGAVDVANTLAGLGTINGNLVVEQGGVVTADLPFD